MYILHVGEVSAEKKNSKRFEKMRRFHCHFAPLLFCFTSLALLFECSNHIAGLLDSPDLSLFIFLIRMRSVLPCQLKTIQLRYVDLTKSTTSACKQLRTVAIHRQLGIRNQQRRRPPANGRR